MSAFSSDLVSETKKHINFLQCLQNAGVLASSTMPTTTSMPATPAMMDRYLNKWLPLVAALVSATDDDEDDYDATTSSLIMIIPPPDVAWLWYCHRLSTHYEVYTKERFGIVIEAHPAFSFQTRDSRMAPSFSSETESHAAAAIKASWERVYSKDSFFLDHAAATTSFNALDNQDLSGHKTLLENFDLTAFCATQAKSLGLFLSQPCFSLDRQHEYLTQAVDEYHTFLQLLPAASTPLVPTFLIDLVWRTHILVSLRQYHKDCIQIQGNRIVYHHTSDIARCAAGAKKLDRAVQTTNDLWQKTYLEPLDDDYWKPPKQMPIVPLQTSTNGSSLSLSCYTPPLLVAKYKSKAVHGHMKSMLLP
jgi:Glycine-rich domain-containing protein-like